MRIYVYDQCSSCRKALGFLKDHGLDCEIIPIRQQPPALEELVDAIQTSGYLLKQLFNVAGRDYRSMNMKDRLKGMSQADALLLLSKHGNLVKRPVLVHKHGVLIGFDLGRWVECFL
ncbi:MAG: ArsC family transcriptional regulator [Legionellales bacterium]|nr:ArsC family transcriptional regulator [Legionellales bacterium]|tara:strand:+ start:278 stop:628 length:351 start_codon:yes stop_codon:yes gene_type:complete